MKRWIHIADQWTETERKEMMAYLRTFGANKTMTEGKLKRRILKDEPFLQKKGLGWIVEYVNEALDEALSSCPLKIVCVYRDNQGRISGFRFESLKIEGKKFVPKVDNVVNAFAKWLVEEFGEPNEKQT